MLVQQSARADPSRFDHYTKRSLPFEDLSNRSLPGAVGRRTNTNLLTFPAEAVLTMCSALSCCLNRTKSMVKANQLISLHPHNLATN